MSQQKKTKENLQDYNLFGNVKTLTEFTFEAKDYLTRRVVDVNLFEGNKTIGFSEEGKKQQEILYDSNKKVLQEGNYKYGVRGEKIQISFKDDFVIKYEYNRKGAVSKEIWCKKGDCEEQYSYVYLDGRLVEKRDKGESSFEMIMYSYNKKFGKPISETAFLGRKVDWNIKYKYNEKGYLTEKVKYSVNKKVEESYVYDYNEDGRLKEKIVHHRNFSPRYFGTVYAYDDKGNTIQEIHYHLDTRKDLIDNEGFLRIYKYTFDEQGNWTRCVVLQNGKSKYIIERVMQYY